MSFLDDETATAGQISLGTRYLGLDPLLPPRRRRQAARQQQAPGYDILPSTMQPIPGVVSTPTDIAQVGVGEQLEQQGTTAAQVPNVFERYAETGAAPIGDFRRYLYPTSPAPEDEEENDVIEAANEEFAENFGFDPSQSTDLDYGEPYNIPKGSLLGQLLTALDAPTKAAAKQANKVVNKLENAYQKGINALTGAQSASEAGYEFSTTASTGQTVPTTESSGRTVTVGAMQGTPFGSTPDPDGGDADGGGDGGGDGDGAPGDAAFGGISAADVAAGGGEGGTYGFKEGGLVSRANGGQADKNSFISMKGK